MKTDLIQTKSREAEDELSMIEKTVFSDYKYGFVTEIEADEAPIGLNEDVIRFISARKKEP
ncbi:MAG TPA: Fe-S cluster assembly protein SufB, partial [Puia sp.]